MSEVQVISRASVENYLSMPECIEAVEKAMRALSSDGVIAPQRTFAPLGPDAGSVAMMPATSGASGYFALKTLSLLPDNPSKGLPAIQGFIALFDQQTGELSAIVDGASVTAIRTAAASGLATRELSRSDVNTHGILGTGVQAYTHARAILAARPNISKTIIWGRSAEKAAGVANELRAELGCEVMTGSLEEATGCDVVSAVTGSSEPIIQFEYVGAGAHINLVGSHSPQKREADAETIVNSRVYVDLKSAALKEAGDIVIPISEGADPSSFLVGEIGEVLNGDEIGRESQTEITIYKSVGHAAQDLFAASAVADLASLQPDTQRVVL